MSLRGFRVLPHVAGGGRYILGVDLVSSSYGTGTAPFTWPGHIWALVGIWSTGNQ